MQIGEEDGIAISEIFQAVDSYGGGEGGCKQSRRAVYPDQYHRGRNPDWRGLWTLSVRHDSV